MQLRSERDADRSDALRHYDRIRSHDHMHEVICGSCGRTYFADNEAYESQLRAMEFDPDNSFVCDACEIEGEDLSHG